MNEDEDLGGDDLRVVVVHFRSPPRGVGPELRVIGRLGRTDRFWVHVYTAAREYRVPINNIALLEVRDAQPGEVV